MAGTNGTSMPGPIGGLDDQSILRLAELHTGHGTQGLPFGPQCSGTDQIVRPELRITERATVGGRYLEDCAAEGVGGISIVDPSEAYEQIVMVRAHRGRFEGPRWRFVRDERGSSHPALGVVGLRSNKDFAADPVSAAGIADVDEIHVSRGTPRRRTALPPHRRYSPPIEWHERLARGDR